MVEHESVITNGCRFSDAISYDLVQLRAPEITLKEEWKEAILAVYEGKVSIPTAFRKAFAFRSFPFCLITRVHGGNHAVVLFLLRCVCVYVYVYVYVCVLTTGTAVRIETPSGMR